MSRSDERTDEHDDHTESRFAADHDGSWSANLEHDRHAESVDSVVDDALAAVRATRPGHHVNLVTHGTHGHPRAYLWEPLEELDRDLAVEYVDQCGCGGHVTRVHVQ
jgi:putative CGCGG family rSAM target protein